MKLFKVFTSLLCLLAFAGILVPQATAGEWDKRTKMTFNEPVEVPGGVILPAGTYIFALVDSASDRHIVRIWNEDGTKVMATILAINNYRLTPTDKTVVTFDERPVGTPDTLHAWFYPGDNFGQEFVYPKSRAFQLAAANKVPVLATPDELPSDMLAMKQVPIIAISPEQKELPVAEVVATPNTLVATNKLPKTASSLPEVLLAGLLGLAAFFMLRGISKRVPGYNS